MIVEMDGVPFVHLFQTKSSKYVFDVNSNEIIRVNDLVFNVLLLIISGLDKREIPQALKDQYEQDEILSTIKSIEECQSSGLAFSCKRPTDIMVFPSKENRDFWYNNYIQQLTLEVTEKCNMSCDYCIYGRTYPDRRNHSQYDMPWEVAKAGLDYMLLHGGTPVNFFTGEPVPRRGFSIGFYGGEPLLNLDIINRSVNYLKEYVEEGRKVSFTLTTNGTLLTPDITKWLVDNRISLVFSLDGPPAVHDRFRRDCNGCASHEKTMCGIFNFITYTRTLKLTEPIFATIACTITGDINYADLIDYFSSLEEFLYSPNLHFNLRFNSISGGVKHWNLYNPDRLLTPPTGWNDLVDEYRDACISGVYSSKHKRISFRMRILDNLVRNSLYFNVHGRTRYQYDDEFVLPDICYPGGTCILGSRRPYLTARGTYLPCERVPTCSPYFELGTFESGISVEKSETLLKEYFEATVDDCKNCWCLSMCSVGCSRDMVVDGDFKRDIKLNKCKQCRDRRHRELTGMVEMLEKYPNALDHYNSIRVR